MEQTSSADALAAYQRSLKLYPKRLNSLLGAARAAHATGNIQLERAYRQEILRIRNRSRS